MYGPCASILPRALDGTILAPAVDGVGAGGVSLAMNLAAAGQGAVDEPRTRGIAARRSARYPGRTDDASRARPGGGAVEGADPVVLSAPRQTTLGAGTGVGTMVVGIDDVSRAAARSGDSCRAGRGPGPRGSTGCARPATQGHPPAARPGRGSPQPSACLPAGTGQSTRAAAGPSNRYDEARVLLRSNRKWGSRAREPQDDGQAKSKEGPEVTGGKV